MIDKTQLRRAAIKPCLTLAVLLASLEAASAAPFCVVGSLNFGRPDCSFWTWQQCRANVAGVGDYCEPNTRASYVFDLSDPGNPRVVGGAPRARPRGRW